VSITQMASMKLLVFRWALEDDVDEAVLRRLVGSLLDASSIILSGSWTSLNSSLMPMREQERLATIRLLYVPNKLFVLFCMRSFRLFGPVKSKTDNFLK